jgi:hypothetical protein
MTDSPLKNHIDLRIRSNTLSNHSEPIVAFPNQGQQRPIFVSRHARARPENAQSGKVGHHFIFSGVSQLATVGCYTSWDLLKTLVADSSGNFDAMTSGSPSEWTRSVIAAVADLRICGSKRIEGIASSVN